MTKRGEEAVLVAVIVLVSLGSYGLGRISVLSGQPRPDVPIAGAAVREEYMPEEPGVEEGRVAEIIASKNGTKYYLPWCSGRSRIAPENIVRFDTETAARASGYEKSATCKDL